MLNMGCHLKSLRPQSKSNLHPNSSCLREFGIPTSHHHMLWKVENYHFTTKSSKSPNVGHCRGNHIMLEPYGHDLCYELVS
jgi:hypothetical protein